MKFSRVPGTILPAFFAVLFSGAAMAQSNAPQVFTAFLNSLNNSGATGVATLALDTAANQLTVVIVGRDLEPGQVHPQHIHGRNNGNGTSANATCPTLEQDTSGDNQVSVAEGRETYGPIMLALEPFPTADSEGKVSYVRRFQLGENGNPSAADLQRLEDRHIVLHGVTVNGQYVVTRPAACGQLRAEDARPGRSAASRGGNNRGNRGR